MGFCSSVERKETVFFGFCEFLKIDDFRVFSKTVNSFMMKLTDAVNGGV